jgi:hypothetical protein
MVREGGRAVDLQAKIEASTRRKCTHFVPIPRFILCRKEVKRNMNSEKSIQEFWETLVAHRFYSDIGIETGSVSLGELKKHREFLERVLQNLDAVIAKREAEEKENENQGEQDTHRLID